MADDAAGDAGRWLRPPEPGEVMIDIAVDEAADVSPEVRAALDNLAQALQESEVSGYAKPMSEKCNGYTVCNPDGKCHPRAVIPVPTCPNLRVCKIETS